MSKELVAEKTKAFIGEVVPLLREFTPAEQLEFWGEIIAFANGDSRAIIQHVLAVEAENQIVVPSQEIIIPE